MAQTGHCGAMTEPGPDDGLKNSFYRKTTRSSRRMTPARRLLYKLAVPLGLVARLENVPRTAIEPPRVTPAREREWFDLRLGVQSFSA